MDDSTIVETMSSLVSNVTITTPTVIIHPPEYYQLNKATVFLHKYFIWIIFAFGFPGNLISLFVIWRMSRRRLTTSLFYVALLAAVDNVAIILKIVENQTRNQQFPMNSDGCGCLYFFGLTIATYANWILIIMSAERFTAVAFPLRVSLIWSVKKAVIIICSVLVFLGLVHAHIWFTATVKENGYECQPDPAYLKFYLTWWFFISSSVYSFIPAIFLTIFNVLIVYLLRKSNTKRRNLLSHADPSTIEARRQERQVTIMLVTVAIVFITLTIPRCVFVLLIDYWKPEDDMGTARKNFVNVFTAMAADSNHAINFYLYFVSGRRFRSFFLELFPCKPKTYTEVSSGNTQTTELPQAESGI